MTTKPTDHEAVCRLYVDVTYDPTVTDPEGLAVAFDTLLETAMSTPGVLEEYGDPSVGEVFAEPPPVSYRYSGDDGTPLTHCPNCRTTLTRAGGVNILLAFGGTRTYVASRLDDGRLVDTVDGAVRKGFHAGTICGQCAAHLTDYEEAGGE